jgi:hypothetical protein
VDNVPRRAQCGFERKIRSAGAADGSFGLVLHVCCMQHGFRLEPGAELPRCGPDRGSVGASASPPPQVQCSLLEPQIRRHQGARTLHVVVLVGDTGIEPVTPAV